MLLAAAKRCFNMGLPRKRLGCCFCIFQGFCGALTVPFSATCSRAKSESKNPDAAAWFRAQTAPAAECTSIKTLGIRQVCSERAFCSSKKAQFPKGIVFFFCKRTLVSSHPRKPKNPSGGCSRHAQRMHVGKSVFVQRGF